MCDGRSHVTLARVVLTLIVSWGLIACGTGPSVDAVMVDTAVPAPVPDSRVAPAAPMALPPIGFAGGASLLWAPDDDLARSLDAVAATGSRRLRLDVSWPLVEPERGRFTWSATDRVVDAARARGIDVLAIIDYAPKWANGSATEITQRPSVPEEFGDFAGVVASHFAGRINKYEIWNEPNGTLFYKPEPDPAYYTRLLQASYRAIKAVDADALVIGASVGLAIDTAQTMNGVSFVEGMYAAGAHGFFDALSLHPYTSPKAFTDNAEAAASTVHMVATIRRAMVAAGDGGKKIWATEFGASTAGVGAVDQARQAYLITAFVRQWAELPFAGPVYIHEIRDAESDPVDTEGAFGVLEGDLTPKPAYEALVSEIAKGVSDDAAALKMAAVAATVPSLGEAVTPVFTPTVRLGGDYVRQDYSNGLLFSTAQGFFVSPTEIADVVSASGFAPSGPFENGMQDLDVAGGLRVFSSSAGVHLVMGAILDAWRPSLGFPTSDEYTDGENGDKVVEFENGVIKWNQMDGVSVWTN